MNFLGLWTLWSLCLTTEAEMSDEVWIAAGSPISPETPWAIAPNDGPRTLLEALYGPGIDPRRVEPLREETLVFGGESLASDILGEMGLPEPALQHEATPGVLYVAMDGVTLKSYCSGAQEANAAQNCSPLVDKETVFPELEGGESEKAAVLQKLQGFYAAYDLVITAQRPPDYLPYTMAVVGGSSSNVGHDEGICGIARVTCGGAKRNHVSLSFPTSCPGKAAETVAQESAHNWGLEHTDTQTDLMYPFVAGASSFGDECMQISHASGSGVTQCGFVHEEFCPEGQGEQQSSHAELLGAFGPREVDVVAPEISRLTPADGSTYTTADSFTISAAVADNKNMVGVKWTWLEGLPPSYADKGYTRCTNYVCTDDFPAWRPIEGSWDMLTFSKPPVGHYKFKIEVIDAYGNYASEVLSFTVVPVEEGTTGDAPEESSGAPEESSGAPEGEEATSMGDSEISTTGEESSTGAVGEAPTLEVGCSCRSSAPPPTLVLALLGLVGIRRRRR